jgi:ribosomal protein L37E
VTGTSSRWGLSSTGRFARCSRCGWLDDAANSPCAQCGLPRELRERQQAPAVALSIDRRAPAIREAPVGAIAGITASITAAPRASDTARRAIDDLGGRIVLLAPSDASWERAALDIVEWLAATRGSLDVWTDVARLSIGPIARRVPAIDQAECVVVARALSLSRAQREALSARPWLIAADPAPLARSLASLHELLALVRPELAGTRRAFVARFGRGPAATDAAALGALLARITLRVEADQPLAPALAPLQRWLDAAPRS